MTTEKYRHHFLQGFQKRAEEFGLEKEALMPFLAHSVFPLASGIAADIYARKGIKALAAKKLANGKRGFLSRNAKKVSDALEAQNMTGVLANTGMMLGSGMAVHPIAERIANKISPINEPGAS
jgi:hypothetical protein